jgi:hypothetical protein
VVLKFIARLLDTEMLQIFVVIENSSLCLNLDVKVVISANGKAYPSYAQHRSVTIGGKET